MILYSLNIVFPSSDFFEISSRKEIATHLPYFVEIWNFLKFPRPNRLFTIQSMTSFDSLDLIAVPTYSNWQSSWPPSGLQEWACIPEHAVAVACGLLISTGDDSRGRGSLFSLPACTSKLYLFFKKNRRKIAVFDRENSLYGRMRALQNNGFRYWTCIFNKRFAIFG